MRPSRELFPTCKDTGCKHFHAYISCRILECYLYTAITYWCEAGGAHNDCSGHIYGGNLCQCPCHPSSKYYIPDFVDSIGRDPNVRKPCRCSANDIFNFGCRCGGI